MNQHRKTTPCRDMVEQVTTHCGHRRIGRGQADDDAVMPTSSMSAPPSRFIRELRVILAMAPWRGQWHSRTSRVARVEKEMSLMG